MNADKRVSVNMTGKVVGRKDGYTVVETVAIDKKGNEYNTPHNVKAPKGLKAAYLHVEGHMDVDANGVNFIDPMKCDALDAVANSDCRMNAWVIGEAASNFIEPKSLKAPTDKKPFGVASVKIGERFQRGIVFNNLIAIFRENLKAGALIRLAGRIQYREYEKPDTGEKRTVCEIICDNNYTEVLKASSRKSPFSFSADDIMVGINKKSEGAF